MRTFSFSSDSEDLGIDDQEVDENGSLIFNSILKPGDTDQSDPITVKAGTTTRDNVLVGLSEEELKLLNGDGDEEKMLDGKGDPKVESSNIKPISSSRKAKLKGLLRKIFHVKGKNAKIQNNKNTGEITDAPILTSRQRKKIQRQFEKLRKKEKEEERQKRFFEIEKLKKKLEKEEKKKDLDLLKKDFERRKLVEKKYRERFMDKMMKGMSLEEVAQEGKEEGKKVE
jgi:hypothetical protein